MNNRTIVYIAKHTSAVCFFLVGTALSLNAAWVNAWTDNFNSINYSNWTKGFKGGNKTPQSHPDTYLSDANVWANGKLHLRADGVNEAGRDWRGGAINTYNKYILTKPKRLTARMRAPHLDGVNSGFWMGPNDTSWPPEIDIVELPGGRSNGGRKAFFTVWWGTGSNPQKRTKSWQASSPLTGSYHEYRVEWWKNGINWYIDGVQRAANWNSGEQPNERMFVYFSCIPSYNPNWHGTPPSGSSWSVIARVDWLKVDRRN